MDIEHLDRFEKLEKRVKALEDKLGSKNIDAEVDKPFNRAYRKPKDDAA